MSSRYSRSSVILITVGLTIATSALAEGLPTPSLPQFQREMLELKERQSQASRGLELDAGERLDLYHLEIRQRREQQWLQERHRLQLEGGRRDEASGTRQLQRQQILQRERQQEMRRFGRKLERWRAQQQDTDP